VRRQTCPFGMPVPEGQRTRDQTGGADRIGPRNERPCVIWWSLLYDWFRRTRCIESARSAAVVAWWIPERYCTGIAIRWLPYVPRRASGSGWYPRQVRHQAM